LAKRQNVPLESREIHDLLCKIHPPYPSFSGSIQAIKSTSIKVNQGQSSQIKVKKIKKYWRKNAQLISRFHRDGSVLFAGGSTAPFFGRFPNEG
jgi:hypothetical protein